MKIPFLLRISLVQLLTIVTLNQVNAQCIAPIYQFLLTKSTGNTIYWLPNSSAQNITYDIWYKCSDGSCIETHTTVLASNALHATLGYIGIALPAGVTADEASIRPLNCSTHPYNDLQPLGGQLITDNIDAVGMGHGKIQVDDQAAEALTFYTLGCDEDALIDDFEYPVWINSEESPHIKIHLYYNATEQQFKVFNTNPVLIPEGIVRHYNDILIDCNGVPADGPEFSYDMTATFCTTCRIGMSRELPDINNIHVIPNPAGNFFSLENMVLPIEIEGSMILINSIGQHIKSWTHMDSEAINKNKFELNDVPAGSYILEMRFGSEVIRTRLVKSE